MHSKAAVPQVPAATLAACADKQRRSDRLVAWGFLALGAAICWGVLA